MIGPCRLVFLHGFLGQASDWEAPARLLPEASVTALDLWAVLDRPGVADWATMSRALDEALADALPGDEGRPTFVIAYSFGARLALSSTLLSTDDSPARGVCLVSCNPGLAAGDRAARAERLASDGVWAQRILTWPEAELRRAWDEQPVFAGGGRAAPRGALPAPRDVLARALTRFSLGGQPDFRPRLCGWVGPLLWLTGARDVKFSALARELSGGGVPATFATCEDAGHRVPWDNPSGFAGAVRTWMARVMETHR